jgi:hypothetical protein
MKEVIVHDLESEKRYKVKMNDERIIEWKEINE